VKKILTKKTSSKSKPAKSKPLNDNNPAHSPGHRKLNIIDNFPEHSGAKVHIQESAVNNLANVDKMKRVNSKNRRIITGAALGKTGRIVIK